MSRISDKLVQAFDTRLKRSRRYMLAYEEVDGGTITLDPTKNVYRATATGGVFPTIDDSEIPALSSYYCFELEVSVPSNATLNTSSVSGWTWISGFEIPTYGYKGKTLYISCRMDCQTRGVTASCWRVA